MNEAYYQVLEDPALARPEHKFVAHGLVEDRTTCDAPEGLAARRKMARVFAPGGIDLCQTRSKAPQVGGFSFLRFMVECLASTMEK
ncbi:hypothetical protein KZ686_17690 [Cupriavidus cauae]|uniref:hypothetical protein n=1 Tax=Cupriavidus TaxID=106589 RepID=UPI001CF50FB8|nr:MULTISPECIES: hypothetical protein [Cupriavidus]MCA7082041.1 hypothetical protein [Cupriavidus sp. DB3]UZN51952.1 hypothetical protein KZ686_17690 [Cupriavidus cauae]